MLEVKGQRSEVKYMVFGQILHQCLALLSLNLKWEMQFHCGWCHMMQCNKNQQTCGACYHVGVKGQRSEVNYVMFGQNEHLFLAFQVKTLKKKV